ncbi:hypothetical protein SAMN05428997_112155 [Bosea sp. CRIB-10]|nr:hypothetical protein SAMN05428997_112155 [Bosea sp. CRIB-10]
MGELIEILSVLAVQGLPGPLMLALAFPHTFAPRGDRAQAVALYGGLWVSAKAVLTIGMVVA